MKPAAGFKTGQVSNRGVTRSQNGISQCACLYLSSGCSFSSFVLHVHELVSLSMEEKFNQYIDARFPPGGKRGTSGVIHAAFAEQIKQCIKNPGSDQFTKEFRYFVKKKKFRTFELPSLGIKNVLVIPRSENKEVYVANSYIAVYQMYACTDVSIHLES